MNFLIHGLSHKTTPLHIRERLVFDSDELLKALPKLNAEKGVKESMIISTCNRTEIYCNTNTGMDNEPLLWMARYLDIDLSKLRPHFYNHKGEKAIKHALRVGSGLDSMVLGEPQILGQLKNAYQLALKAGTIGKTIDRLMQVAFSTSKIIRSNTEIGNAPVSVAFAAAKLAEQIHGDLSKATALLVGAGDTIELVVKHLQQQNIGKTIIANRTRENSVKIAKVCGGETIKLIDIPKYLDKADIVVSSIDTKMPIIGADIASLAIKRRSSRPIFFVDLGVPRNIEESVGLVNSSYLYNVDDLQTIVDSNLGNRKDAAIEAEQIVRHKTADYLDWLRIQDAADIITEYRKTNNLITEEALEVALRQIRNGVNSEEVLRTLSNRIAKKIAHSPTLFLRDAAGDPEKLRSAIEILGLYKAETLE